MSCDPGVASVTIRLLLFCFCSYSTLLFRVLGRGVTSTLLFRVRGRGVTSTLLFRVRGRRICFPVNRETSLKLRGELRLNALPVTTIALSWIRTHDTLCVNRIF